MSISDTISEGLRENGLSGYANDSRVLTVSEALVEREQGIAAQIIEFAGERGLDESTAREVLEGFGMAVAPIATPEDPADFTLVEDDTQGALAEILQHVRTIGSRLDGLTSFARRHGYSG